MYKITIPFFYNGDKELLVYFFIESGRHNAKGKCVFCGSAEDYVSIDIINVSQILCNGKVMESKTLKSAVEKRLRTLLKIWERKSCESEKCTKRYHEEYEKSMEILKI